MKILKFAIQGKIVLQMCGIYGSSNIDNYHSMYCVLWEGQEEKKKETVKQTMSLNPY